MQIKKLHDKAIIPTQGSSQAAGYDLYACLDEPVKIRPGDSRKIPTGLAMSIPIGCAGMIYARSGLATKHGIRPSNCVGVIDSDFRGEVIVTLYNDKCEWVTINPGDRVAQLVIQPVMSVAMEEVGELSETERGEGGFGSTGR